MSDPGQTDALAAEYVLGTLDADELTQAQALAATDPAFVDKVKRWERRLGELHLMVEPVEPEGRIWERIKSKMSLVRQMPEAQEPSAPDTAASETAPAEPAAGSAVEPLAPVVASPDLSPGAPPAESAAAGVVPPPTPAGPPPIPTETAPTVPLSLPPSPTLPAPSPPASVAPPPVPPALPPSVPERVKPRPAFAPLEQVVLRRRLGRWRAWALLMTLLVLAAVGLLGAWKLAPEQLPSALRPTEVLRLVGLMPETPGAPVRIPAPPESQFDE